MCLELLIRDHGDVRPQGYVDSLDVTFAGFLECLLDAERNGSATAGLITVSVNAGRSLQFLDHMRGERCRVSFSQRNWDNLLAFAELYLEARG